MFRKEIPMYTMKQACEEAHMTYQTLKYYCNEGLVPNVRRDSVNRRCFDEATVKWIKDLSCLKKCGMSIEEMKTYLALCLEGPASIRKRQAMLAQKRNALLASMAELQGSIDYVDWKQQFYQDVLDGKRPYVSNLIKTEPDSR